MGYLAGPPQSKVRLCLLTQSLIYGFGLLFLVGIMPEWGRWYSVSPYYSAQAESLLHGDLALSHNPLDLYGDLAWSEGGVQQPWGLGIPILRLPFHMCAKLFGYAIFPEHIATALLFSIVAFLVLKSLRGTAILRGATPGQTLGELGSIAVLLLFPPFIRLLRTRFFVYEEALAYTYLYGILEAVLLFQFLREPTRSRWIIAALVAGFGPWIRPTLIFYSVATWIVGTFAFFQHWKQPGEAMSFSSSQSSRELLATTKSEKPLEVLKSTELSNVRPRLHARLKVGLWAIGTGLFFAEIFLLLLFNWRRFGSFGEFGGHLNIQDLAGNGPSYAARFGAPFEMADFSSAVKELFGWLFFSQPTAVPNLYFAPNLFWGQANIVRAREFYFRAFDWTYLLLLIFATILIIVFLWRLAHRRLSPQHKVPLQLGIWCFISIAGLSWLYLRLFGVTSRYALDFGPCFAVLVAIGWNSVVMCLGKFWRKGSFVLLGAWVAFEIGTARCTSNAFQSYTLKDLPSRFQMVHSNLDLPRLGSETVAPRSSGIPFDGTGWTRSTGFVRPSVNIFVEDAQFLELELIGRPGMTCEPDPTWLRAKVSLEELDLESVKWNSNVCVIRFKAPRRAAYREGIQTVWIAFVPNTHLADETAPWILRRVRWRDKSMEE